MSVRFITRSHTGETCPHEIGMPTPKLSKLYMADVIGRARQYSSRNTPTVRKQIWYDCFRRCAEQRRLSRFRQTITVNTLGPFKPRRHVANGVFLKPGRHCTTAGETVLFNWFSVFYSIHCMGLQTENCRSRPLK